MHLAKLLLAAALVAAPAPLLAGVQRNQDPQVKLDRLLAGRVAGAPQSCITLGRNIQSQIIAGQGIVYRESGRRIFLNRPRGGAEWLTRDSILVTRPVTGRLCRAEPVQLVDRVSGIARGFVTLGDFVPYTRR